MDLTTLKDNLLAQFSTEIVALAGQSEEVIAVAKQYGADSKNVFAGILDAGFKGLSSDPVIKAEGISYAEAKIDLQREASVCEAAFKSVEQIVASDLELDIKTLAQNVISIFEKLATEAFVSLKAA